MINDAMLDCDKIFVGNSVQAGRQTQPNGLYALDNFLLGRIRLTKRILVGTVQPVGVLFGESQGPASFAGLKWRVIAAFVGCLDAVNVDVDITVDAAAIEGQRDGVVGVDR